LRISVCVLVKDVTGDANLLLFASGGGCTVKTRIIRRVDAFKADLIRSSHFFEISDLLASAVH
jgi:hypothetical protein